MSFELYNSDCRNTVVLCDAIITDPPYDASPNDVMKHSLNCSGNVVVFCKPENQFFIPDEYLFWVKTPSTKNYSKNCGRFVEMILVCRKGDTFNQLHWSQMTGVFDDRLIYPPIHPHEKPLSLMERLVRIYTKPGDTVYDPYMGRGTAGLACIRNGRNFIGYELNPEYYKMAEERLKESK